MWRMPSHVFSYLLSLTTAQFCRFQMRSSFRYEDMMYLVFQDYQIIKSKFSYCLLIWMFWSRKSNHLINKLQKNYLRIISENRKSNFEMVLENRKNSQFTKELLKYTLMGKADKILIGNAPAIIKSVFVFWENICNNWSFQVISNINKNTMRYGLETRVKEHLFIGPIYYRH